MRTLLAPCAGQRGSALFIAIVAMLILGVLSLSFVALGNLEMRIGVNHREALEALDLAESAIEHGRDILRGAATVGNFTNWMNTAANGMVLVNAFSPFGASNGTYSVRIDNDCSTIVTGNNMTIDSGCATNQDQNETAVLTAWASKGTGRTRVRIWLQSTNAWKHSCYNSDGILCTAEPEANSSATIIPGDPDHPNGPATGPLPLPGSLECGTDILTPPGITFGANQCVIQPYYDWALLTPCLAASPMECTTPTVQCPEAVAAVKAGIPAGTRNGACTGGANAYGMVFYGPSGNLLNGAVVQAKQAGGGKSFKCAGDHLDGVYASLSPAHPAPTSGSTHFGCPGTTGNIAVVVYVMGSFDLDINGEVNGTVVVHGGGTAGTTGTNIDMSITGLSGVFAIPGTGTGNGYPLSVLVFDPNQVASPTTGVTAADIPQNTYINISNNNTLVQGLVYSAGEVSFNPVTVYGGVISNKSYFGNASSDVSYVDAFGNAAPPPGFTGLGSSSTVVVRRTFAQCRYYVDQTAPTSCDN